MGSTSVSLDELDQQASQSANSVSLDELDAQSPHDFTQEALSGKLAPAAGAPTKLPSETPAPAVPMPRGRGDVSRSSGGYFPPTDIPIQGVKDIAEGYKGFSGLPVPITPVPAARGQMPRPVQPKPQVSPEDQAVLDQQANQRAKSAAKIIEGAGEVGSVALPGSVAVAPLATAASIGTGILAGKGAGAAVHGKVSPEAEELTRQVAFFVPSVMGTVAGVKSAHVETPEGKFSAVSALDGKVKAGIARTPEGTTVRGQVGNVEVSIPPRRPAPVPEPSEAAKALASFEQHTGNPDFQPAPPPPVPPGTNGPEHLTPDVVKGVSDATMQADPAKRPGLMTEAHRNMVKWMVGRGTFVGPDSKIHTVDSEGQAKKLASKFINDEVDRRDAEADKAAKAAEEAPKAQAAAVSTAAPIAGKPPAAGHMTTDTAAVKKVATEANIHPEQQPAIAVKKEPPKETAALAQPPEPVKPEAVAKIGKEDKESGRTILQPSDDVMQNERLAAHAAPELATKLSHIAASIEGATFDRLRPQKELERVDEKVDDAGKPPETVPDYLASQIAADSPQAKDQLVAAIKKNFNVIQVEDNFLEGKPELANYRSVNLQVQMQNGSTSEVQIVPREQQEIANESHVFYTAGREAGLRGDKAEQEKQYAKAAEMHDAAMEKFKQRNGIEAPQSHSVPLDELEAQPQSHSVPLDELEGVERRQNPLLRKKLDKMSEKEKDSEIEQLRSERTLSEKTGLPNYRAFHESDAAAYPHVGYADLDDFKDANAALGHKGVDTAMLPRVGEIIKAAAEKEGVLPFHRSGDEFLFRAKDSEAVGRVIEAANASLAKETFKHAGKEKQGAGLSYGTGENEVAAERAADADKSRRQKTGLRKGMRIPERGAAGQISTQSLSFDPKRFQYKMNVNERGITNALEGQKYNPELAGQITVWQDPDNGKLYVINGHHRAQLAIDSGYPTVQAWHTDVDTAAQARARGALQNIADGHGTAVDAAKYFRDSGITPEMLKDEGVSLSAAKARDGLALAKLNNNIFERVATGRMTEGRGVAIGEATSDPAQQEAIVDFIDKKEAAGKQVTEATLSEIARFVGSSGTRTVEQGGLFGANQQIHSLAMEKAEVSAYVKGQIAKERRIFAAVSSEEKAAALGRVKDQNIKASENKKISQEAGQAEEAYNRLSTRSGPVNDALDKAARELASGYNKPEEIKQRAYGAIREEVRKAIAGSGAQSDSGLQEGAGSGRGGKPGEQPAFSIERGQSGPGKKILSDKFANVVEFKPREQTFRTAAQGEVRGRVLEFKRKPSPQESAAAAKAIHYFQQAQELEPEHPKAALEIYNKLIRENADFQTVVSAHINAGTLFYNEKDFSSAQTHYLTAIELDPKSSLAQFNLANVLDDGGQKQAAIPHYENAIKLAPSWADPYYNLALLQASLRHTAQALSLYKEFLKRENTGPYADRAHNEISRLTSHLSIVKNDPRLSDSKVDAQEATAQTSSRRESKTPESPSEQMPLFNLSKEELRDWAAAAGRRLKVEEMGEQGGLFGSDEKMYRLSTSKQNSVAVTQSQLDALAEQFPRIGRMLGMEQPKREGIWFDYDPPEQSNLFSAGKPPVLTISRAARDAINELGGFRDRFNGANLSVPNVRTLSARLAGKTDYADIPENLRASANQLSEALSRAADDASNSGVTLLLEGSPEHVAHEESFHSAQRGLGEGDIRDHLPEEAVNRLLEHPAAQTMGAELQAMGYNDNLHPSYKIAEIAAKIATGQAEDTSDAADWFVKYVDELHQQHGEANIASAFSNLYDGARALYERAKAAKTEAVGRTASGSEAGIQSPAESLPEHATGPPQESGGIRTKENADGKAYQNKLDQPPLFSLDPKKTITALYKHDIEPAVKGAAGGLKEVVTKGLRVIAPRAGVPSHLLDTIMRMKGQREEELYRFQRTTEGMKKMFDKLPEEARLSFIDRMMHGQRQPSTELEDVADSIRAIQDRFRDQEKVFKPDLTDKENYFHLKWTKLPQGVDEDGNLIEGTGGEKPLTGQGNRPLQGGRSFMKRKTLPDASSGIDRGGELLTTNPIGLLEHRVQESLKFTTARKMWEELKDTPYTVSDRGRPMHMVQFFREGQGQQARALGYEQLNDRIAKVLFPAGSGEGMVHPGEYWVEQNAARLLNNFLSRDLIRESAAGRGIVGLKNATTAWRLAFSPFHALVESIITTGSEVGRGIEHSLNQGVRQGSPTEAARGIGIAAKAPVAPFTAAREGGSAIRYVTSPQEFLATTRGQNFIQRYPEAAELVSDLFTGGAKLAMHEDFRMKMVESMRQAMADNNYIGAALRTPGALSQAIQYPLFEVYIPRLKLGMFLREYSEALADREPEIEAGKLTRAKLARETWDNIDYRFGEVNWDNFFFNRTFKTSLQLAFRAFAWRFGNFAFTGSGVTGQARQVAESLKFLKDAATGGESARPGTNAIPKIDPRMAKLLGLAIFGLIAHGMLQWALTREKPKDAKDLIAPRDGTLDSHGHPNRWTLPIVPYRDLESAKSNPMGYLRGGTADIWTAIPEAINNRDFRNHLISHPSDPYWEQMFDKAAHVVGVPIGVDRYRQEKKRGEGTGNALLGEAGLSRATNYELTPAEKKMREIQIAHYGPETDEDLEAREKKDERIAAGHLTSKEMQDEVRNTMKNNFERGMKSFTYEQAKQVYDVASPEEKALMGMMLLRKRFNSRRTAAGGE